MKSIVLFICLLIGYAAISQRDSEGEIIPDPHRFYAGLSFAPEFAGTYFLGSDPFVDYQNEISIPKISYTGGADFLFILNQLLNIESGVNYSGKGFRTKKMALTNNLGNPVDPSHARVTLTYHCLEIPIKLNYVINYLKFRFYYSAAVTASYVLGVQDKTEYYHLDGTSTYSKYSVQTDDMNKFNLSPTLGAGFDFFINSKMTFRVEPAIRFSVLEWYPTSTSTRSLWNSGINFSYLIGL